MGMRSLDVVQRDEEEVSKDSAVAALWLSSSIASFPARNARTENLTPQLTQGIFKERKEREVFQVRGAKYPTQRNKRIIGLQMFFQLGS